MNVIIGKKLQLLRKQKGWSQEEVASKIMVSKSAYSRMEKGQSSSWVHFFDAICKTFSVSQEEMLKLNKVGFDWTEKEEDAVVNSDKKELAVKLIEQYELRLLEKDQYIKKLEAKLSEKL